MANNGRWASATVTTVLSTELNSLAAQGLATSSSPYDNTSALEMYADIVISLASPAAAWGTNFSGNIVGQVMCSLCCFESVDGTNYASVSSSNFDFIRASPLVFATVPFGSNLQVALQGTARNILIPPAKFKVGLFNNMGTALASSGNTVKILTYGWNTNA